ncbi:hypothetical protein HMPREF3218_0200808 [Prevotella bivia]|uniref:Uncharacterized protein n=1 Tax=Prevotella bivia DSM 20514 TaxID=868129 RepID=I4Z8H9_9BACT|nr:hypothetical protein PrebiDRAFT_0782 [Prevotella bivia DSM 20514]KXU58872.1 hypothetical protein HMPREF3218_0200808 [Prevotella bivia]
MVIRNRLSESKLTKKACPLEVSLIIIKSVNNYLLSIYFFSFRS